MVVICSIIIIQQEFKRRQKKVDIDEILKYQLTSRTVTSEGSTRWTVAAVREAHRVLPEKCEAGPPPTRNRDERDGPH